MSTIELAPGLIGKATLTVADADLARSLGSGDVAVLGTPRLVALVEQATTRAIAAALPEGRTSVGTRVDLAHLAPTPLGHPVTATAELVEVNGKALVFMVEAHDDQGLIGEGRVHRAVVDRTRFTERASQPR
jgi:predicted thioesterase